MMKTQLVTLKIEYDDEVTLEPAAWPWQDLLDVDRDCEVEVLSTANVED